MGEANVGKAMPMNPSRGSYHNWILPFYIDSIMCYQVNLQRAKLKSEIRSFCK